MIANPYNLIKDFSPILSMQILPMFDVAINSLSTSLQEEKISENISQQKKEIT